MPVRNGDGIDALDLVALRVGGVAFGPRIHQDRFARGQAELKSAVSKPGDFHSQIMARGQGGSEARARLKTRCSLLSAAGRPGRPPQAEGLPHKFAVTFAISGSSIS